MLTTDAGPGWPSVFVMISLLLKFMNFIRPSLQRTGKLRRQESIMEKKLASWGRIYSLPPQGGERWGRTRGGEPIFPCGGVLFEQDFLQSGEFVRQVREELFNSEKCEKRGTVGFLCGLAIENLCMTEHALRSEVRPFD